ncbi:MAG: hypothetical protein JW830_12080 [Bacteroidales bacterium]|nr:hypothetical protein [Bacteroidales bacterium]
MRKLLFIALCFLPVSMQAQSNADFDRYFEDQTLRIDYYHTGDAKSEIFSMDRIYKQGTWAGNPGNCIQPFEMGLYKVNVFDIATNRLIFSKGYNSIFAEYQTIEPAIRGIKRTYHESVLIPCPQKPFILIIEKRDRYNLLSPVFTKTIDPADYHIITEKFSLRHDVVIPVIQNGNPHQKVDLVILAEGYQADELDKFKSDLKYYTDLFFKVEPYKSRAKQFNISGIFSASEESGTDEPRQGIYRNTRLGSSFNAFDLDRYCLAEDNKSIRDVAANAPYDAILIMVNRDRYGGGGIYNWQTVFNTGSPWRDYVFLHEFGHAFAGLADEYFSSPVAYVDFYTTGVEPLEPNITALIDTAHVKWEQYLSPGIKVPTEWGKATYDSLMNRIPTIQEESERTRLNKQIDDFFRNHPLRDKVGVFEGANYMSKGMYRPTLMSLMHKFEEDRLSYDIVNERAIIETMNYYTGD